MPFDQKYSPETREASLARVLERRESEPGNRSIIRETADEFQVGEQSLRGWIRAHEKANAPAESKSSTRAAAAAPSDDEIEAPAEAPARRGRPSGSSTGAGTGTGAVTSPSSAAADSSFPAPEAASTGDSIDSRVAELEAEVAKLRRDRETLKSALAVLLSD